MQMVNSKSLKIHPSQMLNCLVLSHPQHSEVWWWIHRPEFGGGFITFIKYSTSAF